MAKPSPVPGLRPKEDLAANARRILLCRLADVIAWAPHVLDPADRVGLHDLRIAIKRLRYALEFLGAGLPTSVDRKRFLGAAVALQESLGAVTDCDAHLRRLADAGDQLPRNERAGLERLAAFAEAQRTECYESARALALGQFLEGVWAELLHSLVDP